MAATTDTSGERGRPDQRKVYVVILPVPFPGKGRPNRRILCIKLNRRSAESVASQYPGSYIEKHHADKGATGEDAALVHSLAI